MAADSLSSTTPSGTPFLFALTTVFLSSLLRSPLHGIASKGHALLSFQGSESGKTHTLPVSYTQQGNQVEIIPMRGWWKNLRGSTRVTLWLKGKKRSGIAEVFYGDETVAQALLPIARRSPQIIKYYQIKLDTQGQPKPGSVHWAACTAALVRIHLAESPQ